MTRPTLHSAFCIVHSAFSRLALEFLLYAVLTALGLLPRLTALCPNRTWHDALYDAFAAALRLEHALQTPPLPLTTLSILC